MKKQSPNYRIIHIMKKQSPNYRIIRIEKQIKKYGFLHLKSYVHNAKITMVKFYAKDDEEAYKYLQDYKKAANRAYDYYYDNCNLYVVIDRKGKRHEFESDFETYEFEYNDRPWYKKLAKELLFNLEFYFICRPKDVWYWLRDNVYLFRNKHKYGEHWSLDCHILDDLKWNLSKLIKYCNGVIPLYLDKAVCEIHKDDKEFDIKKWNETHYDHTNEEFDLAVKYQEEARKKLLNYVKTYEYYRDHGVTEDKALDKLLHHTLPIKKGTYDHFDYNKLAALRTKYWNKIWEWMRTMGETLYD